MLGNTPMIGQNDSSGEIFTLADASTVESYAAQVSLTRVPDTTPVAPRL